jgi:hypothetical protein
MSDNNESKGPVILFFGTWWMLLQQSPLGDYAFSIDLLLMVIGWLGLRYADRARYRLGKQAWWLFAQLAMWCGLFIWFAPGGTIGKVLILWGIGIPLIFAGSGARVVYERFAQFKHWFETAPRYVLPAICLISALTSWTKGPGFFAGLFGALIICALAAVALYYGWQFAESRRRRERDAHFGSEDEFRKAGMADDI